jgi:hypothetical protein
VRGSSAEQRPNLRSAPAAPNLVHDDGHRIRPGWIAQEVAEEYPKIGLRWTVVPGAARATPRIVRTQLEELSDAVDARRAIGLRERATVSAYRVFQRQLGLDPDVDRGPLEEAIVERMLRGAFLPRGLPADACTIAILETGVPLWAIDADSLVGSLGIDESLAIADQRRPLVTLFDSPGPDVAPSATCSAIALFAVHVGGAPVGAVDEALWIAASIASEPG